MKMRKEKMLWNLLLGTGVYLLDSLRDRLSDSVEDLGDRAREGYGEARRRANRAADVIRGEDHHRAGAVAALLVGVGVGVGLGMLLAPASGEETRSNLSDKVSDFSDRVRDKFSERREPGSASYGT